MDDLDEFVSVPRSAVWPVELRPPPGFRPDEPATWPDVPGRLEYVGGRLLYMPPCGDRQQDVCFSVVTVVGNWLNQNPQFVAGGNEAGMVLGGDRRGADAAVWHRSALGPYTGQFRRVPPLLAIEVAGLYDDEPMLRDKARWYLEHDVCTVWLVLPDTREVVVLAGGRDQRFGVGSRLPEPEGVPGLTPAVDDFFTQLR